MISKSTEEYLKNMYILKKQKNDIRVTDIAQKMNCSKPSVTKQLNILSKKGYVNYETYGKIELTQSGEELACKIIGNYDILFILLNGVIGMDKDLAVTEASKMKSVISNDGLEVITDFVNKTLGLNKYKCNFDVRKAECRKCVLNK